MTRGGVGVSTATFAGSPCGYSQRMRDVKRMGQAGLQGWRAKAADAVAPRVSQRAPVSDDQVRALIGAVFFVLSVVYVAKTVSAVSGELRG